MNGLSLQDLGQVDPIAEARMRASSWGVGHLEPPGYHATLTALADLDPEMRLEVVRRGAEWGVMQGLADLRAQGIDGLGQDYIALAVERALKPMLPALSEQIMQVVGPAAQKAADTVGPVLDEKLRKWGPIMAVIAGVVAAVLGIVGMVVMGGYVIRKVA